MAFFSLPYTIFFEDSAACGSRHFLTNFRFQCIIRETLIFEHLLGAEFLANADEVANLQLVIREGYSRNYAPALLGQRIAILLSFSDLTPSSLRLCVRTIRADGEPIAAGYQTIVFTSQAGETLGYPRVLDVFTSRHLDLIERLVEPSFAEAVVAGTRDDEIFNEEVRAYARAICAGHESGTRIVGRQPETAHVPPLRSGSVLTFPGQGSFNAALLRELATMVADAAPVLSQADAVTRKALGASFANLAAADDAGQAEMLRACPDLDQFGIFVTSVLLARHLRAAGVEVGALMGHSLGEIAALCVSGAFDVDQGLQIVAERVRALHSAGTNGGMLAISANRASVETEIDSVARQAGCCVAVINHETQTVVSGPAAELERLRAGFVQRGVSATLLASRYPFHSAVLADAARAMASGLRGLRWRPLDIPVYSPIANGFYDEGVDLGATLASHLTRTIDLPPALAQLRAAGADRFIECGAGGVLTRLVRQITGDATATLAAARSAATVKEDLRGVVAATEPTEAASSPKVEPAGTPKPELATPHDPSNTSPIAPVAIVALGAVLPGAADPQTFWRNILDDVGGIAHLRTLEPTVEADFGSDGISPDKSYSLLSGIVERVDRPAEAPFDDKAFAAMSKAERLLTSALQQCTPRTWRRADGAKVSCLLGSTPEGIEEYDDALFWRSASDALAGLSLPAGVERATVEAALRDTPGSQGGDDPEASGPFPSYRRLVDRMLGPATHLALIDAACASSLYTIDLGMRLLGTGQIDIAYAGGVFSAGSANRALFAQFGGLSATGSRPFDATADGVIFGEGAAILVLKRLEDAIADGDVVHGVIRSVGLSSDGRAPSVNVPRSAGQSLAVRNAYTEGLPIGSVQYVEAHATATPVGDATEFASLSEVFGAAPRTTGPVALGSVKALIGHTGWLAGTASVIKVCMALAARTLPPQHRFSQPNNKIDLAASPFEIPTWAQDWPENADGEPRRAAINGFGFGGTNAHLVLDEFQPNYHARLPRPARAEPAREFVAVSVGGAFSVEGRDEWAPTPGKRAAHVSRKALRLPAGKRLMPDVTEQMDTGQFLALAGADRAFQALGSLAPWRERLGIIVGATGKARRGVAANERIFADRLGRTLEAALIARGTPLEGAHYVAHGLRDALKQRNAPSNAYTLVGIMPNILTGRIANMYDTMGPNMVVDAGNRSLLEAVRAATQMLAAGTCDLVLTGAVNATAAWPGGACEPGNTGDTPDGASLVLLTTCALAERHGLTPLATITVGEIGQDTLSVVAPGTESVAANRKSLGIERPHAVLGVGEFARALEGGPTEIIWNAQNDDVQRPQPADQGAAAAEGSSGWIDKVGDLAAIDYYTPVRVPAPLEDEPLGRLPRRIAYVTDNPDFARAFHALAGFDNKPAIISPHPVCASDDAKLRARFQGLDLTSFDAVLFLRNLSDVPSDRLLDGEDAVRMAELAFAVCRECYPSLESGRTVLLSLMLGAWPKGRLHPEAAMLAGLVKSVARELPGALLRSVAMESSSAEAALQALQNELRSVAPKLGTSETPGAARDVEIAIKVDGTREAIRFASVTPLTTGARNPRLDASSVVVATGGGRGITAVLVEGLLQRFGCTVALLGRSNPAEVPADIVAMSDAEFATYEGEFYRSELAASPGTKMPALRRAYARMAAGRELARNLDALRRLGRVEYHCVDVTNAAAVDAAVRDIAARHDSRINLAIHGAGVQVSKRLPKRSLEEWRATVGPKLTGLRYLHAACKAYSTRVETEYHLITSSMSAVGNDGQADYATANEAMSALAATLDNGPGARRWTALGWLGWAGVGMTRGSEYAALGTARGWRGIAPDEGKSLFLPLFEGEPRAVDTFLLTAGERRYFNLELAPPLAAQPPTPLIPKAPVLKVQRDWPFDIETAPYLSEHLVGDTPTLPGSFEIEFAIRTAREVRPDLPFAMLEDLTFSRFVRVPTGRSMQLRGIAEFVGEEGEDSLVDVRLVSDFIHASGRVLQKDVLHFEARVRLAGRPYSLEVGSPAADGWRNGVLFSDPYLSESSPVRLSGVFDCMRHIRVADNIRSCEFRLAETPTLRTMVDFVTPSLLVDAMLRLATIAPPGSDHDVFVPARFGRLLLSPGTNDLELARRDRGIRLFAATPHLQGEDVHNAWAKAIDADGHTIAQIETGTGRRMLRGKTMPFAA